MSGTSLDGVDIAYVKFTYSGKWSFNILNTSTIPYSLEWLSLLRKAFYYSKSELNSLDKSYGHYLSDLINQFIEVNSITKVDFIASHGHTIHHKPEEKYTLQIGSGSVITNKTGIKIIYDFRKQDVLFGGQGAPLVPIGDKLLFSDYRYCLNLGGFANISFDDKLKTNARIAFDICAVNTVLNHYANKLGVEYDDKGNIAKSGKLSLELLAELNNLDFYKIKPPKSLGFEYVDNILLPLVNNYNLQEKDILHTFIEHVAFQIGSVLKNNGDLLITGGGTFNQYLITRIKHYSENKVVIPSKKIIDYKEALIFAFLGLLRLENKVNCLKSVTGANKDHSSGEIAF